jgi:hypothetical protein
VEIHQWGSPRLTSIFIEWSLFAPRPPDSDHQSVESSTVQAAFLSGSTTMEGNGCGMVLERKKMDFGRMEFILIFRFDWVAIIIKWF